MLDAHFAVWALVLALLNAGWSIHARIAIIAMTTKSSIKVNPASRWRLAVHTEDFDGRVFIITSRDVRTEATLEPAHPGVKRAEARLYRAWLGLRADRIAASGLL